VILSCRLSQQHLPHRCHRRRSLRVPQCSLAVMPEDDVRFESISLVFPLPYRVHFLGVLGVWLFALNLHYFHIVRIDPLPFLRYTRSSSEPLLHQCVYEVASVLSIIFCSNLVLFWFFTSGNPRLVQEWEILPILLFLLTAVVFLQPFISWHKRGRMRFLRYNGSHFSKL
jgi:hypothetical protein